MRYPSVLLMALLLAPSAARAGDGYRLDVGLGTVAPVYMGAQVLAQLPGRFLVSAEAGWMPSPYAHFINGVAQSFDAYNDETADIITGAITGAFVLRPSVGFRPSRDLGLEVMAGYTLLSFSDDITGIDLIKQAVRKSSSVTGDEQVHLASKIHAFHVTLGWSRALAEHWALRATLGYMQALASSTHIDAPEIAAREPAAFKLLASQLDAYLNDKYTAYVKLPTLGVMLNYRF